MASRKRTHSQVEEPSLKERARNACASGEGTTTSELRDIARQLGIRNVSAMSKTKLCEVIHTNISQDEPAFPVTLDESDIPDGLQDPISLELMQDPIIASDGYSYDRVSLRNLFVAEQRRFVASGRPADRPVVVRSLFDRDVVLVNPFGDIGGLSATFPLIENKSLARTISEWRIAHGFDAPDPSSVGAAAAINAEPPESRRDDEGFHNGIFFGSGSFIEQETFEDEEGIGDDEFEPRVRSVERTFSVRDGDGELLAREVVIYDKLVLGEAAPDETEETKDLHFRHLWDSYHQNTTYETLISMLISVALGETIGDDHVLIETGAIDKMRPDLIQSMQDWRNNVIRPIFARNNPVYGVLKKDVKRSLQKWSKILHERQIAPELFESFMNGNRRSKIVSRLTEVVKHDSSSYRLQSLTFKDAQVLRQIRPTQGQSWAEWKALVLRVFENVLEASLRAGRRVPFKVKKRDVRAVFSPQSVHSVLTP